MKKFTKRKIIFGTAALLVLCCVGLAVISLFSPDDPEGKGEATAVAEVGDEAAGVAEVITPTMQVGEAAVSPAQQPDPADTAVPTNIPEPEQPTAVPGAIDSGGLGLSRQEWEQAHERAGEGVGSFEEYADNFSAIFLSDRVWHLEQAYELDELTLEEARLSVGNLIPADSERVETYSPEGFPELVVDLYLSQSLAELFDPDLFTEAEPGNFIVIFGDPDRDGRVSRMVVGLGNNP